VAFVKHGNPKIFNTDQGGQFNSLEFADVLTKAGVATSMDGKVTWRENVFVGRLWRSIKYEEVYLCTCGRVSEARASISRYLALCNERRSHSALDRHKPNEAYCGPRRRSRRAA
jgi:putative transposase